MPMNERESDDLVLLGGVAAGDEAAFGELFDRYAPTVLGFLVQMLRDRAQAEEILQETFLQAWEQADRYRSGGASPRGWLLMIARSRALDRVRSRRSREGRETRVASEASRSNVAQPEGPRRLEQEERRAIVSSALETLPDEQRHCIELAFFRGLTHREIAESLEQPLGTVKSRILLGMKKLRQSLAEPSRA